VSGLGFDYVALLVEESFEDRLPVETLRQLAGGQNQAAVQVLSVLVENVDVLPSKRPHRPYYQQRRDLRPTNPGDREPEPREFLRLYFGQLVEDLDRRGYFARAFGEDCVDSGPSDISVGGTIAQGLGWSPAWPLDPNELNDDGKLYDIIERLHDLVARPRRRFTHAPDYTCMHHSAPAPETGRALFRWEVNELLDDAGVDLRLADDGEDVGRLVTRTDEARTELLQTMTARSDPSTGDRVRHAISLFRQRGATDEHKRSAIAALYTVLEPHRQAGRLKAPPLNKADEYMFSFADKFGIRHGKGEQFTGYDSAYLDWLFWCYLATVEMTDRLSDQSATTTL